MIGSILGEAVEQLLPIKSDQQFPDFRRLSPPHSRTPALTAGAVADERSENTSERDLH